MPRDPELIEEVIYCRVRARGTQDEPGASCLESKEILRERRKNGRREQEEKTGMENGIF